MRMRLHRCTMKMRQAVHWLILLTFLASFLGPAVAAQAQAFAQATSAEAILESMTPEERVGQLFLATFRGTDTSQQSQIYDLIVNHHIGGVVLQAANDNFVAEPDTVTNANQLINSLQAIEWDTTAQGLSKQTPRSIYVPLFIGIAQDGGGQHDQILSGLTPVPDAMAIGATWRSDLAQQVGSVVGKELSAVGFNLLLGPSLDVVDAPNPAARSDLGTTVFGGDPYWVGVMGKAYITGLHEGSRNHLIVVAKHFPGGGSADRSPDEEVATVRKSIDQLKQVDLKPFFTVANSENALGTVDGVLVSPIRYQGFQGNIRATTRPINFDATALPPILALPEFSTWRTKGGLVVSDALGSNAVRNFYAQGAETFSPRLVARDAFNAGNDLLYLGNITSSGKDGDTYAAAIEIMQFFAQQYRNDQVFAQRVDAAVLRILSKKLGIYGVFNLDNVTTADINSANVGTSQQVVFNVARNATTLISPDAQELSTVLPGPPGPSDRIVFLTDAATYQQCSTCPVEDAMTFDALQKNVVRLYGQTGSAQIFANRLISYPFTEITALLNGETKTDIEGTLGRASWVVISITDVSGDQLSILRRLFAERPNLLRNKNVILFSFTAPYYLDATDVSKLTAYYAFYSRQPAFVDVAARLLFQQVDLQGASPVSIPDVGYDLITETSPDPAQVIPLALDGEDITTPVTGSPTAQATQIPSYHIGDTIALRAGPINDHNNHIVPDGTVVQFTLTTRGDSGGILRQVNSTTVDGLARATFVIDKPGVVEVNVTSEPALNSQVLQFNASSEGGVVVAIATPVMTSTPTAILPTPTATLVTNSWVTPDGYPRLGGWLLVLVAIFGSVGLVYWAMSRLVSTHWGIRWALCILIGGLLGYNYLAFGLPGAAQLVESGSGASGMLLLTFVGETLGGIAAVIWMQWLASESRKKTEEQ